MSELTIHEQNAAALAEVYAMLANIRGRLGLGLTEDLETNGFEIQGAALDDDDYAPPMVLRAYADMDLISESGTRIHNAMLPNLPFVDPPSGGVIGASYNGANIAFDGDTVLALSLDDDIPTPEGDQRWWCVIDNEGSANIGLTAAGGVTINGALDEVEIVPGTSRKVSRKATGFWVI